MTHFTRRLGWYGAAALIIGSAVVAVVGQEAHVVGSGSLGEVAAEIRQLRVPVQESTRSQTQTQALGIYLAAQQSRLVQALGRTDAARRELDRLTNHSREIATRLADAEEQVRSGTADPEQRQQYQALAKALQQEFNQVSAQLQQAQSREIEASQLHQAEEARWTELVDRLEQLVRR